MYAEFLPAGDISGDLKVMLEKHREVAGEGELTCTQPSACSPPFLLAATDYALLTLASLPFQLSPLW